MQPLLESLRTPDIKMGKAIIVKTLIDDQGLSYEVEEEIDVPIFNGNNESESADT